MRFITSRPTTLPRDKREMETAGWYNVWDRWHWPVDELHNGALLYWYESPTKQIVWESRIMDLSSGPYESKQKLAELLSRKFADFNQSDAYWEKGKDRGYFLAFRVSDVGPAIIPKPTSVKFERLAWLRVNSETEKLWGLPTSEGGASLDLASIAEPISGDKLYQVRARAALPLLVRQARAAMTIPYSDLAAELGMPNARNLNYVLGGIGHCLQNLSKAWKRKVPPLQCLVVNKQTGLPGEGISWFLIDQENFSSLSRKQQRDVLTAELREVFLYKDWDSVLSALGISSPVASNEFDVRKLIAGTKKSEFSGGGEGERHRRLKYFVSRNPSVIGLDSEFGSGIVEEPLLSGDQLDVSFAHKSSWVGVEVKSNHSSKSDLVRGLFQCVKYRCVMEATQAVSGRKQDARAILVLEGALPSALLPIKNTLGVEVVEHITPV